MNTLPRTGKHTTILALTAVVLAAGLTSGFVHFAPTFAKEPTQVSALNTSGDLASMPASRKVRCIMPPAWRQGCEQ